MKTFKSLTGAAVLAVTMTLLLMMIQAAAPGAVFAQDVARNTMVFSDTTAATTSWDTLSVGALSAPYTLIVHNDGAAGAQLLVAFSDSLGTAYQIRVEAGVPLQLDGIRASHINTKAITGTVRRRVFAIKR